MTCFERKVLIEIRKANAPPVIERFRRYLGQQIGSRDNILTHPSGRTEAVPITEEDYPAECGFVLRQLHEAMAEEEVRRNMVGEDLL